MASELRIAAAALALSVASGCARPSGPTGFLFSYATQPLTTNFKQTPVVTDPGNSGGVYQVQYYVQLDWGDNSIGGLAKEAGFDEVYYADITTLRIYSYFRMERVRVYGHRADSKTPAPPPPPPARDDP
jgi:hypothetical protein